jgi:hypothetical protein
MTVEQIMEVLNTNDISMDDIMKYIIEQEDIEDIEDIED